MYLGERYAGTAPRAPSVPLVITALIYAYPAVPLSPTRLSRNGASDGEGDMKNTIWV